MKIIKPSEDKLEEMSKVSRSHSRNKICKICGVEFDYGYSNATTCGICKLQCNCSNCNKEFSIILNRKHFGAVKNAIKFLNGEKFNVFCCHSCEASNNLKNFNNSEASLINKQRGRQNIINYNNSEKCKEHRKIQGKRLGYEYGKINGPKNLIKYNKSEKGREKSKEIGNSIGKINLKNSLEQYKSSEEWRNNHPNYITSGLNKCIEWSKSDKGREFAKNHAIELNKSSIYSIEKITSLIENSEFNYRKDVQNLLIKVKNLINYNEEINNLIVNKAKELGIPTSWREEFYQSKFEGIKFNDENTKLTLDSLENLNIPGVWSIWNEENTICMDVAQTNNIAKEILAYSRRLDFNKNLTDEQINLHNNKYNYNRNKFRDISKDCNCRYILKLVAKNIDTKEERELIEAQYAHDNKARYWSFAPGQINKINKYEGEIK